MILGKKILAIVPARSGSSGLKNKNIKKIKGIHLLGYTGNFIKQLNLVDECIISTDSQKYQKIAKKYNINSYFLRSKKLSGKKVSDYEVIIDALNKTEKINSINYDVVIYLQPTSPLRKRGDIIKAIKILINEKLDTIWSASLIDKKFHPLKILEKNKHNFFDFYHKKGSKIIARQQLSDTYIRNGCFYIFTCDSLKKYKSTYGGKNKLYEIKSKSINIDDINDFNKFKKYINDNKTS